MPPHHHHRHHLIFTLIAAAVTVNREDFPDRPANVSTSI
jgi:hypothetical protein